jgi:ABC-type cobalamin transport system permease subunit
MQAVAVTVVKSRQLIYLLYSGSGGTDNNISSSVTAVATPTLLVICCSMLV